MIPQDVIDNIINTANIVDVIGDYVKLKKAGVNYKGVCPFHGDKDASLVVSPAKNIWKCFGCGKGGNVITFVKEHEGISFFEAVKLVASKYNITVPEREPTMNGRKRKSGRPYKSASHSPKKRLRLSSRRKRPLNIWKHEESPRISCLNMERGTLHPCLPH